LSLLLHRLPFAYGDEQVLHGCPHALPFFFPDIFLPNQIRDIPALMPWSWGHEGQEFDGVVVQR
jgi:hypothetical protein